MDVFQIIAVSVGGLFLLSFVVYEGIKYLKKRRSKKRTENQSIKPSAPLCPLCSKGNENGWFNPPKITDRPKEISLPWFKLIYHWHIGESEIKVCATCYERARAEMAIKFENIKVQRANYGERLMKDLVDFQLYQQTPLKDRDKDREKK